MSSKRKKRGNEKGIKNTNSNNKKNRTKQFSFLFLRFFFCCLLFLNNTVKEISPFLMLQLNVFKYSGWPGPVYSYKFTHNKIPGFVDSFLWRELSLKQSICLRKLFFTLFAMLFFFFLHSL